MLLEVTVESESLAASLKGIGDFSRNVRVIRVPNTKGLCLYGTSGKKELSHF